MTETIDGEFSITSPTNTDLASLNLQDVGDLARYLTEFRPLNGGHQAIFWFPNNFGASVVRHGFSYGHELGLLELAVLRRDAQTPRGFLCYSTEITDDVLGNLTPENVVGLLTRIMSLDDRGREQREQPSEIQVRRRQALTEEQQEISRKMGELARRMSKVSEELVLLNQTYEFDEED
jgi:hypothetical protein